jgi:hypothetical protein
MKKSLFGKTLVVLFALLLNAQSAFAIVEEIILEDPKEEMTIETPKSETMKKYEELKKEWDSIYYGKKSYLRYIELKMLQDRMQGEGQNFSPPDRFYEPEMGILGGSSWETSLNAFDGDFQGVLNILLGTRAIQESLQLESIGINRTSPQTERTLDLSSISPLEIASHDYEKMIQDEGLSEKIQIPEVSKLAPADTFFVSFESEKLLEFSTVIEKYTKDFSQIYRSEDLARIKIAIMKRLGLPENEEFLKLTSEVAFVSEDLDFLGRTDFALIVKFKDSNSKYIAKMLQTGENAFEQVGDFFVFATHKNVLERIKKTYQETASSLAQAKDFQYAIGSLDSRKNGIVYFSDTFIRKLTSPEYRINARRKNTAIHGIMMFQYTVFAYKDLEGFLPKTFSEIDKKYPLLLPIEKVDEFFNISSEGEVSHKEWGSLLIPTPVSRVQIEKISESEKELYERFRTEYNQFFQEFFDPIGVAIMVSDRIAFQTIILPLIDNSEYNWVKAIFGGNANKPFDFLEHPDRETAFSLMSKLRFDDFLAMVGKEMAERDPNDSTRRNNISSLQSAIEQSYGDDKAYSPTIEALVVRNYLSEIPKDPETGESYLYEVYNNGQCYRLSTQLKGGVSGKFGMENDGGKDPNLYERGNCLQDSEYTFKMASPAPTQKIKSEAEIREEAIRAAENDFRNGFDLPEGKNGERVFDFLGDEVMFGMGESTRFSENDLSLLDIFVGIELSNPEKAKTLLEEIFTQMTRDSGESIMGELFSSNKPIKNTYNGKEFYMVPLGGFLGINIFYIFEGNRFYITISQNSMNQIIDGMKKEKSLSEILKRTLAFTGTQKNILLLADFEKFENLFEDTQKIEDSFSEYILKQQFSYDVAMLSEAWEIEKILNPSATDITEVKKWHPNLPTDFFGLEFVIDPETLEISIKKDAQIIPIENINYDYYSDREQSLTDILKGQIIENPLQKIIETIKSFGIGFAFTDHGLDVRVAFSNPLSITVDESFSIEKTDAIVSSKNTEKKSELLGILFGGAIVILGAIFFFIMKRRPLG